MSSTIRLQVKEEEERKNEMKEQFDENRRELLNLEEEYELEEGITVVDYDPEELHEEEVILEEEIEVDEEEQEEREEEELIKDDIREGLSEPDDISGPEEEEEDDQKEQREVLKEHRKRKEFEVFVGGLDKDATENDIRKAFADAGE